MHKQNAQVPEEYVLWTKKKQRRVLSIQIFLAFEIFTNAEMLKSSAGFTSKPEWTMKLTAVNVIC